MRLDSSDDDDSDDGVPVFNNFSLTTAISSTAMTSSSHARGTAVLQARVALRPDDNCLHSHGKGKQKVELDENIVCVTNFCDEAFFDGSRGDNEQLEFLLQTSDPVEDLKRYLTHNNKTLVGDRLERADPDQEFPFNDAIRYSNSDLREALKFGHEQMQARKQYIIGLASVARREPYRVEWDLSDLVSEAGKSRDLQFMESDCRTLLDFDMVKMAGVLDDLGEKAEACERLLLRMKMKAVIAGNVANIERLLGLGYVTVEQVQEVCELD